MEIRKELFKQAKKLRKKGKFSKVKHNRLISFDTRQNSSEFDTGNEEQAFSQIFLTKSSPKQDFKFQKTFKSFEMAPNNFEFDFAQISFNTFESRDGNIFQDDRDPDLNYFDETNILSKETTYINETDMKNLICETQRFENVSVLHVNTR